MKLLLTVVVLAAFAHASPITTVTMEIGADGVQSGRVLNIPLVEIVIKIITNAAEVVVPEIANEPVLEAEPVIVVDETQNLPEPGNPIDVISILPQPEVVPAPVFQEPGNPIDIISVNPVAPQPEVVPAPIVLPEPTPAEVVPAPIVLPEPTPAEAVPAPIVLPAPTPAEVVPAPIVLPEPTPSEVLPAPIVLPEFTPAEVVPAPIVVPEPTPAEVIEGGPVQVLEVEPVQVFEEAPETFTVAGYATSDPTINVMMNFVFGNSNTMSST